MTFKYILLSKDLYELIKNYNDNDVTQGILNYFGLSSNLTDNNNLNKLRDYCNSYDDWNKMFTDLLEMDTIFFSSITRARDIDTSLSYNETIDGILDEADLDQSGTLIGQQDLDQILKMVKYFGKINENYQLILTDVNVNKIFYTSISVINSRYYLFFNKREYDSTMCKYIVQWDIEDIEDGGDIEVIEDVEYLEDVKDIGDNLCETKSNKRKRKNRKRNRKKRLRLE